VYRGHKVCRVKRTNQWSVIALQDQSGSAIARALACSLSVNLPASVSNDKLRGDMILSWQNSVVARTHTSDRQDRDRHLFPCLCHRATRTGNCCTCEHGRCVNVDCQGSRLSSPSYSVMHPQASM